MSSRSSNQAGKCLLGLSLVAASLSFAVTATAASPKAGDAYQKERQACMDGTSRQERTACLREAAAARGEAKRGHLTESSSYESNATQRCNALPAADRDDCVRRVQGGGTVSGSVEDGGLYRETRTTVPAAPMYAPMPAPLPPDNDPNANANARPAPPPVPAAPMYAPMPAPVPAR